VDRREKPTVFVIDDDRDVRKSLQWLLATVDLPVRTYASAEDFLADYRAQRAGCILLDVQLPGMDGFELLARLQASGSHSAVLMVTGYGDIPMAVRALKSGAFDFIEKPYTDAQILARIQQGLASDEVRRLQRQERAELEARHALLTPREREVMQCMVEGRLSKQIAHELGIGDRTVETHRQHIMKKMQAGSVAELVRLAMRLFETP
jgi:two-component system, LuxR family, response regulator FixJ